MNNIHRKSAISKTADLIWALHERGEGLLWERYEQQLPLCAFTDNGLNCRKCFQGPCRINPFGDEPSHGVCGADRDQIVMENVFQATLRGVLDTARSFSLLDRESSKRDLSDFNADLPAATQRRLSEKGLLPVSKQQLFEVQNSYFSHKGYLSRTLMDLTRIGLIHYGLLKGMVTSLDKGDTQKHSFSPEGINIMILGHAPMALIEVLRSQTEGRWKGTKINLIGEGPNSVESIYSIADHGTPEFALAMNLDAFIIAPDAYLPSLESLASKFSIPATFIDETKPIEQIVSETMDQALRHKQNASYLTPFMVKPSSGSEISRRGLFEKGRDIKAALQSGQIRGIVVLLGETNVKQTFFERALTLIESCIKQNILVLLGGELGRQRGLLIEELQRRAGEILSTWTKELEKHDLLPIMWVGSYYEIPKVVSLLKDIGMEKGFNSIPAMISFPEFFRASTWVTAVSLLALGFGVQIGTHLPFWGSPSLAEVLLQEWTKISGGTLLASPSLASSQTQSQEILSYLETRKIMG